MISTTNFEELCRGYCDIAGAPRPRLRPDSQGRVAFFTQMRDVQITALDLGCDPDSFILIAEFCTPPQEQAKAGWLALMDVNLFMMEGDAPRFRSNAPNGEIILQWTCPLWGVSSGEMYRRVAQMVDMALLRRDDPSQSVGATWPSPVGMLDGRAVGSSLPAHAQ